MKITLSVPIKNPNAFVDVEAELLFDLAPHLAEVATFAVNKAPDSFGWYVSNVETGLWVASHYKRAPAIRLAAAKLKTVTPEGILAAYANVPKMYPQLVGIL